jgi:hypothetical protein
MGISVHQVDDQAIAKPFNGQMGDKVRLRLFWYVGYCKS